MVYLELFACMQLILEVEQLFRIWKNDGFVQTIQLPFGNLLEINGELLGM